jgi:hypothetical protein
MAEDSARDLIKRLSDTLERTQKTVDYEGACTEPTSRKRHALIAEARLYLAKPTSGTR